MFKNARIIAKRDDATKYHAQEAARGTPEFVMSSSALRAFAACPSKWINGWELPPSSSLEYGSLFDNLVLTPEQFDKRYAVAPSTYESRGMECPVCKTVTKSKKCGTCKCDRMEVVEKKDWNYQATFCSDWKKEQLAAGKEVVTTADLADAQAAVKRLYEDDKIKTFLDACETQWWIEAEWHDDATGIIVPVKCLIDLVGREYGIYRKSLGDLKTTCNAAIGAWANWAHKAGYEIQAAWNTDLLAAAQPERELTDFVFILSENYFPWETGRRYMSQDLLDPKQDGGDIASGRRQYERLMAGYCACVKSGRWPGFDDTDEASASGWTLVSPDPFLEQRRQFAPKFQFAAEEETAVEKESSDDIYAGA